MTRICDVLQAALTSTVNTHDLSSKVTLLKNPFIFASVGSDDNVIDEMIESILQVIFDVYENQHDNKSIAEVCNFCGVLMSFKKIGKLNEIFSKLEVIVSRIPTFTNENILTNSAFHHIWLLLKYTQITLASRPRAELIPGYFSLLDETIKSLILHEYWRTRSQNSSCSSASILVKVHFKKPNQLGACSCIKLCWKLLLKTIIDVSETHSINDKGFWDIFNYSFNSVADSSIDISTMIWVYEEVAVLVSQENPHLQSNWSTVQELVKQSCSQPIHLPQVLTSLVALNGIWRPPIIITMTLQQEFIRQLLRSDNYPITAELTSDQYLTISDAIANERFEQADDTIFKKFLCFYVSSLLKTPEVKKINLLKRVFNIDMKSLCNIGLASLQNYGLWIAVCMRIAGPGNLDAQILATFASQCGDFVSNSRCPSTVITIHGVLIAINYTMKVKYDVLVAQLGVMINRISEDYFRHDEAQRNKPFDVLNKSFIVLHWLSSKGVKLEIASFVGPWLEMFLEEGHQVRLCRILHFGKQLINECTLEPYTKSFHLINKHFIAPLIKFLRSRSLKEKYLVEAISEVLSSFSIKLYSGNPDRETARLYDNIVQDVIARSPLKNPLLSFNWVHSIITHENAKEMCRHHRAKFCRVIFSVLSLEHVLQEPSVHEMAYTSQSLITAAEYLLASIPAVVDIIITEQNILNFPSLFISRLCQAFTPLPFNEAQALKDFTWKLFNGLSANLYEVVHSSSEKQLNQLYDYVATVFETIPNLLFSANKEHSPLIDMFAVFWSDQRMASLKPELRKSRTIAIPRVFNGLATLSYKSNNMFFKDIMKVFDDVYPILSLSDWRKNRDEPYSIRLFRSSFVENPEKSVKSFRKSFMLHLVQRDSTYIKSDTPDKLAPFLYMILKLEYHTKCTELIIFDFVHLYRFILEVIIKTISIKSKNIEVDNLVKDLLKYYLNEIMKSDSSESIEKLFSSQPKMDIVTVSQRFIDKHREHSLNFVIETFARVVAVGGRRLIACCLEYLENCLYGRFEYEYKRLQISMKISNLGNLDHSSCMLIKINNVHIMLDCSADVASLTPFLPLSPLHLSRLDKLETVANPECKVLKQTTGGQVLVDTVLHLKPPQDVDLSLVDAILVTNNSQISALPYVMMDPRFHGRVYATEPCVMMGRLTLIALSKYMKQCPKRRMKVDIDSVPADVHPIFKSKGRLREIYSEETIEACFAKITPVRYNEQIDLFGLVTCIPIPAGHTIGSANWIINNGDYKVSYISSSSKLIHHTLPMEVASLANPDVMILNNLSLNPMYTPDSTLIDVCNIVTMSVKKGGNVLIPCHCTGVLLDLIEWLISHLSKNNITDVPIIIVSPVADAALAHPDIYGEWLNATKQSKLYVPELPFAHSQLIKSKRIHHFASAADGMGAVYKTPCIVFAGHPSLRCGDAVLLLEKWKNDPQNAVILIEPEYPIAPTLAPFQPMYMKSCFYPIDPSINYPQAAKLIKDIKPKTVVTSPTYSKCPVSQPNRTDLVLNVDRNEVNYRELGVGDIINLPEGPSTIKVKLQHQTIHGVTMQPLKRGAAYQLVAYVSGAITARDNKPVLVTPNHQTPQELYGEIQLEEFLVALSCKGISVANVQNMESGDKVHHMITLSDQVSTVTLSPGVTSIATHTGQLRQKLESVVHSLLIPL